MATQNRKYAGAVTAMIALAERRWAPMRALRSSIAAAILWATLIAGAAAAPQTGSSQEVTTPPKLDELLTLLADPKVHQLLTLLADPKTGTGWRSSARQGGSAKAGWSRRRLACQFSNGTV